MLGDILINMSIGMALRMVASTLMMKAIKSIRQRRKVSRMLREVAELQKLGQSCHISLMLLQYWKSNY